MKFLTPLHSMAVATCCTSVGTTVVGLGVRFGDAGASATDMVSEPPENCGGVSLACPKGGVASAVFAQKRIGTPATIATPLKATRKFPQDFPRNRVPETLSPQMVVLSQLLKLFVAVGLLRQRTRSLAGDKD